MTNVLHFDIVVSEFELLSRYSIHFRTHAPDLKLFIPPQL